MSKEQKTDSKTKEATKTLNQTTQSALDTSALGQLGDLMTLQRAMANPRGISPRTLPSLQRSVGNSQVQQMVNRSVQRQASAEFAAAMEAEAGDETTSATEQRPQNNNDDDCPDCPENRVTQRQVDDTGGVALDDATSNEINQEVGGGQPLPGHMQAKMKQNLGITDPENIKVHTDTKSDRLNQSLRARAFTSGSDIFFRQGEYNPNSSRGQELLYHESWHTRQQGATGGVNPQTKTVVNPPDDKYEQEADDVAEQAVQTDADRQFAAPGGAPNGNNPPNDEDERYAENPDAALEEAASAIDTAQRKANGTVSPNIVHVQRADEDEKDEDEEPSEEEIEGKKEKSKDKMKGKAKDAKDKGEKSGKEKGEEDEDKKPPKEEKPKSEKKEKAAPPEKVETDLPMPEPEIDSTEVAYEPEANMEEPEMDDAPLPTWEELAAGTVQLSAEDVAVELNYRNELSQGIELGTEAEEAAGIEEGEEGEELDRGELIGDALAEGALEGVQEGATEFIADQVVEAATSKIPYADGFINMAQLAYDPKKWVEDNVFSIGTGAVDMVNGFKAIGDEDTAWGYMAATLEAIVLVIDFVNSIVGLINTIFTIILALAKVMMILGNLMIALAPTAPFCILCWMAAPGSVMVTVGSTIISFLDPINALLGTIGNILNLVKLLTQPVIMLFRILDILETEADPEKLKEKQEKLKGATKGFTKGATQQVANRTKDAAMEGAKQVKDKKDLKKAEAEANKEAPRGLDPTAQAEFDTKKADAQKKFEEKKAAYNESYGKYEGLDAEGKPKYSDAYAKTKDKSTASIIGSQFKAKMTATPFGGLKKSWEGVAGAKVETDTGEKKRVGTVTSKAKKTASEKWEETKSARNRPDQEGLVGTAYRTYTTRKAKGKVDEAETDLDTKKNKLKEADDDVAEKRRAWQEAPPGSKERREAFSELSKAKKKRADAFQEKNQAETELAARKRNHQEEEAALGRMLQAYDKRKKWEKEQWKLAGAGFKEEWKNVGGFSLSVGDQGGQRHGPGVTGASGKLFDMLETAGAPSWMLLDDFLLNAFGGGTDYNAILDEAESALNSLETTTDDNEKRTYRIQAANLLGKIDLSDDGLPKQVSDKQDQLDWLADHNYNQKLQDQLTQEITDLNAVITRATALNARADTLGVHWGEEYDVHQIDLELHATGLDAFPRADSDSTVFVIKQGSKTETNVSETDHTETMLLYKDMSLSVVPQSVELVQADNTNKKYNPDETKKSVVTETGKVTVTIPYQAEAETAPAQTKLQRAPGNEELDTSFTKDDVPFDEPAIDLQSVLGNATRSGDVAVQRAPADDLEEEPPPVEDFEMPEFDEEMEAGLPEEEGAEDEFEEEAFVAEEPPPEAMAEEPAPPGEESEEDSFDLFSVLTAGYEAQLLDVLPPPPEGVIEQIQGASLAYDEVVGEEYGLRLQQQQIGGLQQHGQGQLGEVKGTRALGQAHQQGVAMHQEDTERKLAAQNKMQQSATAQQETADKGESKGSDAMGFLSGIFSQILAGFGLPIPAGGGADTGSMNEGTKDQAEDTSAAADVSKQATQISNKRMAETEAVKSDAAGVQSELEEFDSQMADEEAGTEEGLDELDEAQSINEDQLATAQEEKERLRDQQSSSLEEADAWAEEHRSIREDIFSMLEEDMAAAEQGEAVPLPEL